MTTYRAEALALADASAAAVVALPEPDPPTVAALVATANVLAWGLADVAVAAVLGLLPHGTPPPEDRPRLTAAAAEVLGGPEELRPTRLGRLARSEPLAAGQTALVRHMAGHGVTAWTRRAAAEACEACRAYADGTALPTDQPMARPHPGCSCVAVPA